jgi:outer membrane protein assembly factor BamB
MVIVAAQFLPRLLAIVFVLFGTAFSWEAEAQDSPAPVEAWPAFRGGSAQGRVPTPLPTRWSADDGVRWKTAVPGRGYSSPIVFGDRIYVTTADLTVAGLWLDTTLRALTLGLTVIVGALAMVLLARRCHPARSPAVGDLVAASGLAAAVLALAVIGGAGDALFDFARCNIRGWLMSMVFASICVVLIAAGTNHARTRVALGLGMMVFAAFALVYFPSKDYAFRGGISSLRMQISIAASVVPLLIGGAIVFAGRRRGIATSAAVRKLGAAGVAVVLMAVGALLLWHLLVFRDGAFPEMAYEHRVSRWWLLIPVAAIVLGWLAQRLRLHQRMRMISLWINVAIAWLGGVSILLVGVIVVELLATRSVYLTYQIGEPRLEPTLGRGALWSAALAFVTITLVILYRSRGDHIDKRPRLPMVLGATALTLAAVFFARVNYVTTETRMVRAIISLDRQTGDVRWTLRGLEGPQPPIDGRNSPATPTPVTDGTVICAYFGNPGLMCADVKGGLAWSRTDIAYEGFYGVAFSLVLSDGLLILANDRADGQALVQALDVKTGATRWTRTFPTKPTITGNNRTPLVREVQGEKLLIMWGLAYVKALSLRSGEPVWHYPIDSDGDLVAGVIADGDRLYLSDRSGTTALDYASLTAGRDPVRWKSGARANCATPVLVNGMLFTVSDSGIAAAQQAETGEVLWRQRLPGHYFASLIASPNAVYFTNSDGLTSVVAAEPAFRLIARNDLREEVMASMASAGGELYIRSANSLYAVAPTPAPAGTK